MRPTGNNQNGFVSVNGSNLDANVWITRGVTPNTVFNVSTVRITNLELTAVRGFVTFPNGNTYSGITIGARGASIGFYTPGGTNPNANLIQAMTITYANHGLALGEILSRNRVVAGQQAWVQAGNNINLIPPNIQQPVTLPRVGGGTGIGLTFR